MNFDPDNPDEVPMFLRSTSPRDKNSILITMATDKLKSGSHFDNTLLLEALTKSFSLEELKTLAFKMDLDHENIDSSNKTVFAREFILAVKRQDKELHLFYLLLFCREAINWLIYIDYFAKLNRLQRWRYGL